MSLGRRKEEIVGNIKKKLYGNMLTSELILNDVGINYHITW